MSLELGGGLIALQSLSTIQNGTGSFNFQSNELLPKFLRQHMAISKILLDVFWENTMLGGGIHPPST